MSTVETINADINKARCEWMIRNHSHPSRMYIGIHERTLLDLYADRYLKTTRCLPSERSRYMDMAIFVVDAHEHLDFGYL